MEQKFYVASKGSWYLSVTNHPGELTKWDIVNNIVRMVKVDLYEEDMEADLQQIRDNATKFYYENLDRIMEIVEPGVSLKEMPQEELEDILSLPFSEWEQSEFPRTEWD